jgi:hypothetical protein
MSSLPGSAAAVFIWTKRSGERGRTRFLWWPLVLSIVVTILLNLVIRAL